MGLTYQNPPPAPPKVRLEQGCQVHLRLIKGDPGEGGGLGGGGGDSRNASRHAYMRSCCACMYARMHACMHACMRARVVAMHVTYLVRADRT